MKLCTECGEQLPVCESCGPESEGRVDCDTCDGDGEITCDHCNHSHECEDCDGFGEYDCDTCNGTGYLKCRSKKCVSETEAWGDVDKSKNQKLPGVE